MPSKSTLILLAVGAVAGYLVTDSLINKDFNGQTAGTGFNPFRYGYAYGYSFGSGTPVSL